MGASGWWRFKGGPSRIRVVGKKGKNVTIGRRGVCGTMGQGEPNYQERNLLKENHKRWQLTTT